MTPSERREMWVSYVKASPARYTPNALAAVFKEEGKEMTSVVLKQLGLTLSVDLIEKHAKEL
jgi:hypothetical protein